MILISINIHFYEFERNIKALWHKVQIKTDLYDVTLSCEDKQIKTHRLIISSYYPIDDLSVTKGGHLNINYYNLIKSLLNRKYFK